MPAMPSYVHVMDLSEIDLLLHFCANFILYWIQICTNECGYPPFQKTEMGDTDIEAVRAEYRGNRGNYAVVGKNF